MSNVYFRKIDNNTSTKEIKVIARELLEKIVKEENITFEKEVPLKIHFGEKGNETYVKSDNYEEILNYLKEQGVKPSYIETTVLYNGQRHTKELLLKTAKEHGFDQIPVIVADGEYGEYFDEIEVNQKHFKTCKIGGEFSKYNQAIVLAHFKGHAMAGFGGAIKQLSMGYAAKGGKLAMHKGVKPYILEEECKKCHMCEKRCNLNAITINDEVSVIDEEKCVGCGACFAICQFKAVVLGTPKEEVTEDIFTEKLVEYAYAAQLNKNNIYMNFAMNITKGCDCEPKKMSPIMDDFGIFISTDPVAIDKACFDMAKEKGKEFNCEEQLFYAEKIGFGSTKYTLINY